MKSYQRVPYDNFFLQACGNSNNSNHNDSGSDTTVSQIKSATQQPHNQEPSVPASPPSQQQLQQQQNSTDERVSGNGSETSTAEALYLSHYPNLMVNRYGNWMDTNVV
jgi:hypothetical protein